MRVSEEKNSPYSPVFFPNDVCDLPVSANNNNKQQEKNIFFTQSILRVKIFIFTRTCFDDGITVFIPRYFYRLPLFGYGAIFFGRYPHFRFCIWWNNYAQAKLTILFFPVAVKSSAHRMITSFCPGKIAGRLRLNAHRGKTG